MNLFSRASRVAMLTASLALLVSAISQPAWACGGFFCNAGTPVNQSAERILFARDSGTISMHIQIQYEGPPTEFGWILPTAPDVETKISSEALFAALDRLFAPAFQLRLNFPDDCPQFDFAVNEADPSAGGVRDDGVQVLSREAIGPYDRAILSAESVEDLRAWLDEQEFQIPGELDPKFQPYIDAGAVFVVIKLLPGNDSGDIVPLNLVFSGDRPSIPIIPTSVAATPDMGVIAHVLDSARAVPVNYRHVQINEAAIDWVNGGLNYPDVVSQAVDEAGGRAFTTDFAGPHEGQLERPLTPYDDEQLSAIESATTVGGLTRVVNDRTNPDFQRVAASLITLPEGVSREDFFRCPSCYEGGDEIDIDGAALAARLREEVNPAYEDLGALFGRLPYLTRLYTTLSADEMNNDPIFSINPDMGDVENIRVADADVVCDDEGGITPVSITLADGRTYEVEDAEPTQRQDGETVRGADLPAAAVIEQTFEAGQPEEVMSLPAEEMTPGDMTGAGSEAGAEAGSEAGAEAGAEAAGETGETGNMTSGSSDGKDEGCEQSGSQHPLFTLLFAMFAIFGLRRRQLS